MDILESDAISEGGKGLRPNTYIDNNGSSDNCNPLPETKSLKCLDDFTLYFRSGVEELGFVGLPGGLGGIPACARYSTRPWRSGDLLVWRRTRYGGYWERKRFRCRFVACRHAGCAVRICMQEICRRCCGIVSRRDLMLRGHLDKIMRALRGDCELCRGREVRKRKFQAQT